MNWKFAYSIGFHPWEDAAKDPAFVAKATELFEREELGREPPYGPALDLGTGSCRAILFELDGRLPVQQRLCSPNIRTADLRIVHRKRL
jgi:hypothetical protein